MKRLALALLVVAAATACNREVGLTPTPISFADHPGILRGAWSGTTASDQTLRLELSATYDTAETYTVAGTGLLDGDSLTVTGSVIGGAVHRYLQAQTTPVPETASLILKRSGAADLRLNCFAIGDDTSPAAWTWQCFLPDYRHPFTLTKDTP
ncbi:hypothetical protein HLB42_14090 [Deinococcus sp. D7000]|uniref:hypothetical protein n=1 Tax=Deinococcus radiopugnans TaxID=57497 RepID=UPI0012E08A31|nr:hypothetical protein [Deinococcus radiopugnans]QLG11790.1 hypothetical protein HLB42_14090 [Deinococcus sp. D7000]